jgi:hypothetical protein
MKESSSSVYLSFIFCPGTGRPTAISFISPSQWLLNPRTFHLVFMRSPHGNRGCYTRVSLSFCTTSCRCRGRCGLSTFDHPR